MSFYPWCEMKKIKGEMEIENVQKKSQSQTGGEKPMILRKYMSLIGIGSAEVDLVLDKDVYRPGEAVHGCFYIKGGTIEQQIKRIDCDLVMEDSSIPKEETVDSISILSSSQIESEKTVQFPFSFQLPESLSASTEQITYKFKTLLTFTEGLESQDSDHIKIISKRDQS